MSKLVYRGGSGTSTVQSITLAAGTTTIPFNSYGTILVTPNATASYTATTTAATAGDKATLLIVTSGTSSYTITFSTGFKPNGTLATGTVTAKTFALTYVFDGTNWLELSRTTAL
jgi:hypothetical protein